MAVFKCKMCGGALDIEPSQTVAECHYCGTSQTLPRLDNDRRAQLLDRANGLRRDNEFDKAEAIYEQLLNEDAGDAEVYWSLVLCRYGVEYIKDPVTQTHIPTVNRAQYTAVFDDTNYKQALRYADISQRALYEKEAVAINEIQKGILAISKKEEPFDIFICYKESDTHGQRTPDSVIAQELYYQLTKEGFKVFFSRITLENKLGTAYEPYIFAALNSAKVMVVVGTCREHFEAVWVKNEWSRYLALIRGGAEKMLIPAYRDMDPYHLPAEFAHLQAQDMSKLGFMQDLVHGIQKIVRPAKQEVAAVPSAPAPSDELALLLKRIGILLEDGLFERADELCEQVLNRDPENAWAYVYQLCVELGCNTVDALGDVEEDTLDSYPQYDRVLCYGDDQLVDKVRQLNKKTHECKQQQEETRRLRRQQQEEQREADKRRQQAEERKKELRRREEEARQKELLRKEAERREQLRREEEARRAQLEEQRRMEKQRWREAKKPFSSRNTGLLIAQAIIQIVQAVISIVLLVVGMLEQDAAKGEYVPFATEIAYSIGALIFVSIVSLPNWISSSASFVCAFTKANLLITVAAAVVYGIGMLLIPFGMLSFAVPQEDLSTHLAWAFMMIGFSHVISAVMLPLRKTRRHVLKSMQ